MQKKSPLLLSLAFLLIGLCSCNPSLEKIDKVVLDNGTIEFDSATLSANQKSHMREIDLPTLNDMVEEKRNFLLLVGNQFDCSCWTSFHNEVLVPYLLENHLLLSWIPYQENQEALQKLGLQLSSAHETLAIFQEGEVAYQHTTADSVSSWVKDAKTFASWMDARIEAPRLLSLSLEQLDQKYSGREDFSILFSRSTCGDCTFLERFDLKEYFQNNLKPVKIPENFLYVLNCDQVGIRYVKDDQGNIHSPSSSSSVYAEMAQSQWEAFKEEYGLASSAGNPAGWGEGFVPTIYHIHPNSGEKKGDVIDFSGVFYNETVENGIISESYFTQERLSSISLDYLSSSSLAPKVLTGAQVDASLPRHEALQALESPILTLLLDSIL